VDERPHQYKVTVAGLPNLKIESEDVLDVPATTTKLFVLRVQAPITDLDQLNKGSHRIQLRIESITRPGVAVDEKAAFFIPR